MKQTIIKSTFLFIILISFLNCEKEETIIEQKKIIETVSIYEALSFFNTKITKKFSKTSKNQFINFDLDNIDQEAIINSDQLLTIIPVQIENKEFYSRILLLKINNEIESVVFSMVGNEKNEEGHFYGKIYISDLDGHFVNGFRVEDNNLVARLISSTSHNKSIYSKDDACVECPYNDCSYCSLDEVVITTTSPKIIIREVYYTSIVPPPSEVEEEEWNPYENVGGGVGSNEVGQVVVEEPDDEIIDMEEYLNCIDTTKNATLTIHADQPITNSSLPVSSSGDVGHAFATITQNGNTVSFGFYPKQKAKSFTVADGAIGNNQNHEYDASVSMNISASTLSNIINFASSIPNTYNINLYNCTDYVIDISNFTGLNLPDCYAFYPGAVINGGSSPSVLGQYIRNLPESSSYTTNTETANAPSQSGNCND